MAITFVSGTHQSNGATSRTSQTITAPPGIINDDFLIGTICNNGGDNASTWTAPTGWTFLQGWTGTSNPKFGVFWKKAANESGNYTWSWTTSVLGGGGISVFRGVDTTTPWDVAHSEATSGLVSTVVAPSITTVTDGAMLIVCVAVNSSSQTFTPPTESPAWVEAYDLGQQRGHSHAYVLKATAGATGTKTWTQASGGYVKNILLGALRPATAGPAVVPPPDGVFINQAPTRASFW